MSRGQHNPVFSDRTEWNPRSSSMHATLADSSGLHFFNTQINDRVVVSFGIVSPTQRQSFPRRRESSAWTAHF